MNIEVKPGGLSIPCGVEESDHNPVAKTVLARFEYSVPPWLKQLLDSVLESMVVMDVEPVPNSDPDSDKFRDHFFLELVLRLAQDVGYETTAGFLAEAIRNDLSANKPRHRALLKAIDTFLNSRAKRRTYDDKASALSTASDKLGGLLPTFEAITRDPELVKDVRRWARLADACLDHVGP